MKTTCLTLLVLFPICLFCQNQKFELADIQFLEEFISPSPVDEGRFGSPEIEGNVVMVGEIQCNDYTGAVHVYNINPETDELTYIQTLTAADADTYKSFGSDISVYDTIALIGAFQWEPNGESDDMNCGAVYVFAFNQETELWYQYSETLTASPPIAGDMFGVGVEVIENTFYIGSMGNDDMANNAGCFQIYTYADNNLSLEETIYAPEEFRDTWDMFGCDFGIEDNILITGAWQDNEIGENADNSAGAAYIYQLIGENWEFQERLAAYDPKSNSCFGESVTLENGVAYIGAHWDSVGNNPNQGSVYVFENDGSWTSKGKFTGNNSGPWDNFGVRMAANNNYLIIGAWTTDVGYYNNVSCYLYKLNFSTDDFLYSTPTGKLTAFPNPAKDIINIANAESIDRIEIFDSDGKTVLKTNQVNQIDISSLKAGLYLMKTISENEIIITKIIVE